MAQKEKDNLNTSSSKLPAASGSSKLTAGSGSFKLPVGSSSSKLPTGWIQKASRSHPDR